MVGMHLFQYKQSVIRRHSAASFFLVVTLYLYQLATHDLTLPHPPEHVAKAGYPPVQSIEYTPG